MTKELSLKKKSTLKTLNYPLLADGTAKPGQVRLGEHSDFGTMTFLFQDDVGGLEVKLPGKGFIHATPTPGTILVVAADLLQRWTDDAVISCQHRVLLPDDKSSRKKPRQSVVFFIVPDDDCLVTPLNGSKKYQPITCMDYISPKMKATVGVTY